MKNGRAFARLVEEFGSMDAGAAPHVQAGHAGEAAAADAGRARRQGRMGR